MSSNLVANHYNNIDTNNVPVYVQAYPNDYYMSQNQNTCSNDYNIPQNQNTYSNNYYIPQNQNLYAPRDSSYEANNYLGNDSNGGEIAIGSNSPVELFTDNKHATATTNIQLEDNNYERHKSIFGVIFFTIGLFIAGICLYNYFHVRK